MSAEQLSGEFLTYARTRLGEHLAQVVRCAGLLSEEEIWHRAGAHANSVGNLVLHLTGNVRQWIVSGLGGEPFERDRPAEFAARGSVPRAELVQCLQAAVANALGVLGRLDAQTLLARRTIQGYELSGLVAVFDVVEHFAGHAGQIVHITKCLRDVDLSLYDAQGHKRASASEVP